VNNEGQRPGNCHREFYDTQSGTEGLTADRHALRDIRDTY